MSRCLTVAALISCLAAGIHGGKRQWTAQEEFCADSLGVPRARGSQKAHPDWVKYLAWSAEIAVFGDVKSIAHDIDGPYHTLVTVLVTDYWKGDGPSSLVIALHSGPSYSSDTGRIVTHSMLGEPTFDVGEEVVLFLDRAYFEQTVGDPKYALPPNHWRVTGRTKLLANSGVIIEATSPSRTWPVQSFRKQVDKIVNAQAQQCAGGTP